MVKRDGWLGTYPLDSLGPHPSSILGGSNHSLTATTTCGILPVDKCCVQTSSEPRSVQSHANLNGISGAAYCGLGYT